MRAEKDSSEVKANPVVFISYAHADMSTALAVDQWLRDQGARILIDQRDFIPGNDIEAEIVRCIQNAGKLVCIYSRSSAMRPYPQLERRIAAELERADVRGASSHRRLIYFCIDDTELPLEAKPRLAIMAKDKSFQDACQDLWAALLEESRPPVKVDLDQYDDVPPWGDEDLRKDLRKHQDEIVDMSKELADSEKFEKGWEDWVRNVTCELENRRGDALSVAFERVKYFLQGLQRDLQEAVVEGERKQEEQSKDMELDPEDNQFWGKAFLSITSGYLAVATARELQYSREKNRRVEKCLFEMDLHEKHSLWRTTGHMIDELVEILGAEFGSQKDEQ